MTLALDWSTVTSDVVCPLCEYNLRGLVENRCPECGYVFDWNEVLHPEIVRHPYLFEHNPKRPIRSFFATLGGGMRPRRFWNSLRATHRPVAWRLFLYAFLCASMLLLLPGLSFLRKGYDLNAQFKQSRAVELKWSADPRGQEYRDRIVRSWGSVQAYLDAQYPHPMTGAFVRRTWDECITPTWRGGGLTGTVIAAIPASIAVVLWPWMTFLTLMIFLASMRRASVRPIHVIRCAVYSSDAIWLVPLMLALLPAEIPLIHNYTYAVGYANVALIFIAFFFALLVSYRLACAYRLYLKFPHAPAVAIASQLILLMIVIIYALNSGNYY